MRAGASIGGETIARTQEDAAMRYRELTPDLQVSEIGFGNWTVTTGWWGSYTRAEARELHRAAFDAGITFFDTSNAYAEGYAEAVLGEVDGGIGRERPIPDPLQECLHIADAHRLVPEPGDGLAELFQTFRIPVGDEDPEWLRLRLPHGRKDRQP
jgi:hypothetical protein